MTYHDTSPSSAGRDRPEITYAIAVALRDALEHLNPGTYVSSGAVGYDRITLSGDFNLVAVSERLSAILETSPE